MLDAKYTEFANVDTLAPGLGLQDVEGNSLNAPKRSANAGVAYRTDPLSFGHLTARANVSYRPNFYFREFNLPLDAQKAYTLMNLAPIWDSPDEKYRVRLYGTNITNEAHIVRMNSSDNFGSFARGASRQAERDSMNELTRRGFAQAAAILASTAPLQARAWRASAAPMDAVAMAQAVRTGKASASELVEAAITRLEKPTRRSTPSCSRTLSGPARWRRPAAMARWPACRR